MPPKKKSLPTVCNPATHANKRASEFPLLSSVSAKRRKHADENNSNKERTKDSYCWICHQKGKDVSCKDCQRVYHTLCLNKGSLEFKEEVCPECQHQDGGNQSRFLNAEKLRETLKVAASEFRRKFQTPEKMIFFQWPNIEDSELVRIIDFDLLEDNIKDERNPYTSLAKIISDIKWIHHNYCILDGVDSPTAKEAEGFVRTFQKEISDIEDCPKCYYHMLVERRKDDFFVKICDPPHDIVWAWLKGSSSWPAKCLRVENGKAHVRFFGTHDKANIPIANKKCLAISLNHPTHKNSKLTDENLIPKKKEYKIAVNELLIYIDRYERKFGKKFKFYDAGTPYKCEAIKPGRKKKNRDRRNVFVTTNPEEITHFALPPTENTLDGNEDMNNQSCNSIDASALDHVNISDSNTFEDVDQTDATKERMPNPSTSPVLTASMEYEVASCDNGPTEYNCSLSAPTAFSQQNLNASTSLSQTYFQPLASSSSTPTVAPTSARHAADQLNAISISNPHNCFSNNTAVVLQDGPGKNTYLESQQMHSQSEAASLRNIPLGAGSTPVAENTRDVEEDVIFLHSTRPTQQPLTNHFGALIPFITHNSPDMQALFRTGQSLFDTLFIRLWSHANQLPQATEIITCLAEEVRKLRILKTRLREAAHHRRRRLQENLNLYRRVVFLKKENKILRVKIQKSTRDFEKEVATMQGVNKQAISNSSTVCSALQKFYTKHCHADVIDQGLKGKIATLDQELKVKNQDLDQKTRELEQKTRELEQKTRELEQKTKEQQEYKEESQRKDVTIKELSATVNVLNAEAVGLRAKNQEAEEAHRVKLEELLKLQKEKATWEAKQDVTGMVNKHLHDLGFTQSPKQSSGVVQCVEQNPPVEVHENLSGNSKKSSRANSSKSQSTYHRRRSFDKEVAVATDQHFCHQMISQQEHVKTVARKTTSVNIQMEHTTTKNDGNVVGYHRPPPLFGTPFNPGAPAVVCCPHPEVLAKINEEANFRASAMLNAAFDLSHHRPHADMFAHPTPPLLTPPVRGLFKDSRKQQTPRYKPSSNQR